MRQCGVRDCAVFITRLEDSGGRQRRSGATVRVLGAARARGSVVTTPKCDCRDVGLVWFYSGVIVAVFVPLSRRAHRSIEEDPSKKLPQKKKHKQGRDYRHGYPRTLDNFQQLNRARKSLQSASHAPLNLSRSMECPEVAVKERGRNFRLLSPEELPLLLDFLTGYLPESLKFHQTLLTYLEERVWEFHFYVADGWPKQSPICIHFPGMTLSPHGELYESVGVFCPGDRLDCLQLLRTEDVLVDWSRPLYMNFMHSGIVDELVRLYEGTGSVERIVGDIWACEEPEKTMQAEDDVTEPDNVNVRVRPLRPEHAEGIHELYPANDMECHEVFLRLIKTLPAAGVFDDDRLAAWMVQSYYGAMFSMQTRPEYRRKGYGTKLARYLTKAVSDRGFNPFVVIRPENNASRCLYTKLGFRKLYQTARATFTPEGWEEPEEDGDAVIRDNLENAVRQLKQRVMDEEEISGSNGHLDDPDEARLAIVTPPESPGVRNSNQEKYASEEEVDPGTTVDEPKLIVNGDRGVRSEEKENLDELEAVEDKEVICAPEVEDSNEGDGGTESNGGRN